MGADGRDEDAAADVQGEEGAEEARDVPEPARGGLVEGAGGDSRSNRGTWSAATSCAFTCSGGSGGDGDRGGELVREEELGGTADRRNASTMASNSAKDCSTSSWLAPNSATAARSPTGVDAAGGEP